ncbi:2-C-methyl-D-erythritol 4-phosphate cytidylyltransferase [Micrococcales bacterium 31B]|nr:2-C-methyl-D-erythritol 4-phosphate cytidylyltransferase [Micrococcales bacterium 31B]
MHPNRDRGTRAATAAAVVLAGGSGTRVGAAVNKVFLPLAGRSIAAWALNAFAALPEIGVLVFVVRAEDRAAAERLVAREVKGRRVEIIHGGDSRQASEMSALRHLAPRIHRGEVDSVLLHDAARPFASSGLIMAVLQSARESGAVIPAVRANDLVKLDGGKPDWEASEVRMVRAQTPQGFAAAPLLRAYERAARDGFEGTDTAACVEEYTDLAVRWVAGEATNLKVTFAQDLLLAQEIVQALGLRSESRA